MKIVSKLDELIKSAEAALEKMNPIVAGALSGAAAGAVKGAIGAKMGKKVDEATDGDGEILEKPPVSEAQRRAMHAAAAGNSTLGIPKSVGKDFSNADKGGKLPEKAKKANKEFYDYESAADESPEGQSTPTGRKYQGGDPRHSGKGPTKAGQERAPAISAGEGKSKMPHTGVSAKGAKVRGIVKAEDAEKAENTLDYGKMKTPKAPETEAPTITYGSKGSVARTPGAASAEAGFKVPKEKKKPLADPKFRSKLVQQRRDFGIKKSEASDVAEHLTKSLRSKHSDQEIGEMIKAAVDAGKAHRNVYLEWQNFKTVSADLLEMTVDEE